MAAELEQAASRIMPFDVPLLRTPIRVDRASHHEHFAEPAVSRSVDGRYDAFVPPPQIAQLNAQISSARFTHQFTKGCPVVAGRLFEMQVLAGGHHFPTPRHGLPRPALDHNELDG